MHTATQAFLDVKDAIGGSPSLRLLGKIAEEFGAIPYENLTKFIKKHHLKDDEVDSQLDTDFRGAVLLGESFDENALSSLRLSDEVISDYIQYGSGGTCFSLTNALRIIATDLGFTVYPAMADMKHGPNIHCALVAIVEGERYIVDPGYLVVEPVPLRPGKAVSVKLPGHRIAYEPVKGHDAFSLYTVNDRGEKVFRYVVRPVPVSDEEFLRHWIESFSANGMNGLHLNMFSGTSRLSAHNFNMRVDDGIRKKNVKLKSDYSGKISSQFGIEKVIVDVAYNGWRRLLCRE